VRRKERCQHYMARDRRQQLRAWAAASGVTESSVIEAALSEYFDRERTDKEWLGRRLDLLAHGMAQVQNSVDRTCARVQSDVDLLFDALGASVRHAFLPAIQKPGPDQEQRVESAYQTFLRRVFEESRESGKFKRQVRNAGPAAAARAPGSPFGGR
jgi:hypothetical protein